MKKTLTILLVILIFWASLPQVALAASPEHDLDDCTSGGTDITTDCQDGGSEFSGDWTNTTAGFISKTSGCYSGNCIEDDGAGNNKVYRTFDATADGTGSIVVNRTDANVNNFRFNICADGTTSCEDSGKFYFRLLRSGIPTIGGDVQLGHSGGQTDIGDWTTSTDELIEWEWGDQGTCATGEIRARFDGGSWSSCLTMNSGNDPGTVEFITDDTSGGDDVFWDELVVNVAVAGAEEFDMSPYNTQLFNEDWL